MVAKFADKGDQPSKGDKPSSEKTPWQMLALFSGATLQLPTCIVVFGYFGHVFAVRWHHAAWSVIGVVVGTLVGASGLAFLAKQFLGDKP